MLSVSSAGDRTPDFMHARTSPFFLLKNYFPGIQKTEKPGIQGHMKQIQM